MFNRFIPCIICISIAVFIACKPQKAKDNINVQKKTNIVLILADDLGYGGLSCYGQTQYCTPNIDSLAFHGIKFTQHYCGSTICAPSRSSLLTGLHTGHTPIRGNKKVSPEGQLPLPQNIATLPTLLQKEGYVTGAFGKWGLGYPGSSGDPNSQGFNEFFGYNCQLQSHRYYPPFLWHNNKKVVLDGNDWHRIKTYAPDIIQKNAINFIDNANKKPFFLYLAHNLPHPELIVPEDSIFEKYKNKYQETPYDGGPESNYGNQLRIGAYCSQQKPNATYAAMMNRLDLYVGQIVNALKKNGVYENTIIIFTSDNGPNPLGGINLNLFNNNGNLRGKKLDLYEGGIRVPLIVSWPQKIKKARTSNLISGAWDILPTCLDIAEIDSLKNIDGISFLPELLNKKQTKHDYLYWEFYENGGKQALRMGNWKYLKLNINWKKKRKVELYNLTNDPEETKNLANTMPDTVNKLDSILSSCHTKSSIFKFNYEN